jgi:DNA polymerase III delta prime subunit
MITDKQTLFYDKYQPNYFVDYGNDNEVINTLQILNNIDNINILLVGNSSSGKTSILKTIVKEYYYGYTPSQYNNNVMYINSLKDQGICYYRTDVKTFCQTSSVIKNKKKIIVLDDIDLINEQSQQVFRNCIDKYKHQVQFICSCTSIQKVIDTIQSRLLIIKIKPLQKYILLEIIHKIKNNENIQIDDDAIDFIIRVSNNNIKVIISYMEQFKLLNDKITIQLALQLCFNINYILLEQYTIFIIHNDLEKAITLIYDIYDKGYSVMDILDTYFHFIKTTTLVNEEQKYIIIQSICKYISIFYIIHEDEIELALFTNNLISLLHNTTTTTTTTTTNTTTTTITNH